MEKFENVGTLDAYMRITFGLTTLAYAATGRLGRWTPLLGFVGAMKVAEGVTRYCPMLGAMGVSTRESVLPRSHRALEPGIEEPEVARTFGEPLQGETPGVERQQPSPTP